MSNIKTELPNKIKIMSKTYTIKYHKNPSEVDIHNRESLWGQVDFWSQSIRIYKGENKEDDIWHTILHEILHVISNELHIEVSESGKLNSKDNEKVIDLLSLGLLSVLKENKLDFSKLE